ncbi:MAG: efflux RND transporter permease subunit, partial [Alphaproteobacteria bacterium]
MNFATWSIRNPIPPVALFLMLSIAGLFAFTRLPVTEFPNVDVPIVSITITQPGAAPAELSGQIIKPVEDAIANIAGIDHITSRATDSRATIVINFTIETPTDRALNDVKDAVSRIRQDLPETISEPIVKREELAGKPIQTYTVANPTMTIEALSKFADDVIARRLLGLDGVGGVVRIGGADRVIRVDLDPDRLLSLGITAGDVSRQLRATNTNMGGGRGDLGGVEFSLRVLGNATSVAELAATPITLPSGQKVRLEQLGQVRDGSAEARDFATLDGRPVVALAVYRATGASDLDTARAVEAELDDLRQRYPEAIIEKIDDSTTYTAGNFDSAMQTLYEGMALAVLVVFAFLRNARATLIAATALPLSILPAFFGMYALDFSLNTVSLLAITLVTGILVDDAIVEVENIERHLAMGKDPVKAAGDAATEIGLTVIAISLTIVAVFAPVSFMGGIPGQFFKQFGLTVAIAALASLGVARLITPLMAAQMMKPSRHHGEERRDGLAMRLYLRLLRWTLRHKFITLLAVFAIFAASIYSATLLPGEFTPKKDIGRTLISLELPPGTTLAETRLATNALAEEIGKIEEVRSVFVEGGAGGDINKANLTVNYGPKTERARGVVAIEADILEVLRAAPDARAHIVNDRGNRDISLSVLGSDREAVTRAARELARQMKGLAEVTDVSTTAALPRPEIQLIPRPDLAAEFGITANALASVLRVATLGDTDANLAKFTEGDEQYPIVVRLRESERRDLLRAQDLRITTPSGASIPVRLVADARLTKGPSVVTRYDREFETKVEASLAPGFVLGQATAAIDALPVAQAMPEGTRLATTGDAEIMADVFAGFATAMGAGLLLVYALLSILFSSFVRPIVVLLTLPLAVGGAIFALYIFDMAMGISVVIGFLLLMGIVTKNAIMLLAFALDAMKRGASRAEAMVEAGHKRARPIIMTSIAMTAGMLPSAFASHLGGEFRAPMAVAVIGGILLSTALSLVFVPVLFSVVDGARDWLARRIGG